MPKHYHITVIANDGMHKNKIHFVRPVSISLIGFQGEKEAEERAKQLIKRKFYTMQSMFECNTCRFQQEAGAAMKKIADHE